MNDVRIFIIDCETCGLKRNSTLLSFGGVVVNKELEILDQIEVIINVDERILINECDDIVIGLHQKSGLWNRVLNSDIDISTAKKLFIEFVDKNSIDGVKNKLCNNTVRMDYSWLEYNFDSDFVDRFSYRTIDISSLNELCEIYNDNMSKYIKTIKQMNHTALNDALDSLEELRYYREMLFNS